MKKLIICLTIGLVGTVLQAQDHGLYWKYKDYDGAISITAPRWLIHTGSWFLDEKEDRKMVRKVRKVRVLVFDDGENPVRKHDLERFNRKARRRNLEELLMVRSADTHVRVWAKERREAIRKVVVLVQEPETFAMVSLRGKLRFEELGRLLDRLPKDGKDGKDGAPEEKLLPDNVRSVIRI